MLHYCLENHVLHVCLENMCCMFVYETMCLHVCLRNNVLHVWFNILFYKQTNMVYKTICCMFWLFIKQYVACLFQTYCFIKKQNSQLFYKQNKQHLCFLNKHATHCIINKQHIVFLNKHATHCIIKKTNNTLFYKQNIKHIVL